MDPITRRRFSLLAASAPSSLPATPNASGEFFYRPADAWAADFIPLFSRGR